MDIKRELEIAREARQVLEQILFDGPVPDDGHLIYKRAIQLRKIEEAARAVNRCVSFDTQTGRPVMGPGRDDALIALHDVLAGEGAGDGTQTE